MWEPGGTGTKLVEDELLSTKKLLIDCFL